MTKKLPGGMTFTEIETSRPAMEGAVSQTYGILFSRGFQVHAIRMRDTYYVTEHMSLAGLDKIRFLKHLTRVKIAAFHNLSQNGYAYVYSDMAQEAMSKAEADQLNAMRTLLIQSETKQNVSVWSKVKMVNDSIASMPGFSSLGSVVDRYGPMLDDPSIATVGMFVASIASLLTPLSLYGLATDVAEFFEGLF